MSRIIFGKNRRHEINDNALMRRRAPALDHRGGAPALQYQSIHRLLAISFYSRPRRGACPPRRRGHQKKYALRCRHAAASIRRPMSHQRVATWRRIEAEPNVMTSRRDDGGGDQRETHRSELAVVWRGESRQRRIGRRVNSSVELFRGDGIDEHAPPPYIAIVASRH